MSDFAFKSTVTSFTILISSFYIYSLFVVPISRFKRPVLNQLWSIAIFYNLFYFNLINDYSQSLYSILFSIIPFLAIFEFTSYVTHRMLHSSFLYKFLHVSHHKQARLDPISAHDSNPIDFILTILLPIILPPVLLKGSKLVFWIWIPVATFFQTRYSTNNSLHYEKMRYSFGPLGVLDWILSSNGVVFTTIIEEIVQEETIVYEYLEDIEEEDVSKMESFKTLSMEKVELEKEDQNTDSLVPI